MSKVKNKGTINFLPVDENERYWELELQDTKCLPFFREVWPYLTMGDLCKMSSVQMTQIIWSAHGYGIKVLVKDEPRW